MSYLKSTSEPELARLAATIGEPTRVAMLAAMLGGQALPAGELARRAGVAPATASAHLLRMMESGLITRRSSGRHRYYALAGADVAAALEALARIAPVESNHAQRASNGSLRFARTCYDRLAGTLGVLLTDTLMQKGLILGSSDCELTAQGQEWLCNFGIDMPALRASRRPVVRACLDWSERRDHLAGAVGTALLQTLLVRRWLVRVTGTRAVRLTLRGREGLYRTLGLELNQAGAFG